MDIVNTAVNRPGDPTELNKVLIKEYHLRDTEIGKDNPPIAGMSCQSSLHDIERPWFGTVIRYLFPSV